MTGSIKAAPTLAIGKMVAFMAHLVRSLAQDSPSLLQWALEPFGSFGALLPEARLNLTFEARANLTFQAFE